MTRLDHPLRLMAAFAFTAFLVTVGICSAKPGGLDRSFGNGGRVTTGFDDAAMVASMAIDSKQRIVAVGTVEGQGVAVTRYLQSGQLDPTFSGDGRAILDFGVRGFGASDIAIDADGRIVIGGTSRELLESGNPPNETYWFAVARLNRDGSPDASFSRDGIQVTRIGVAAELYAIAIDRSDRIVAVGSSATNDEYYDVGYAVARYLPGGRLDPSFSGDGIFTGRFGRLPDGPARVVAIDRRGRVLVGGAAIDGAPTVHTRVTRFALVRLTDRGNPDRTFSGDGKVRTAVGNDRAVITDLAIDREGRIVAAGNSRYATVVRYLPNGRLDPSFSGDGKAVPDLSLNTAAMALDRSGRIVLAGDVEGDFPIAWAVARLTADGSRDKSFGGGAAIETAGLDGVRDVVVDRKGRIVAAGGLVERGAAGSSISFALQRYDGD